MEISKNKIEKWLPHIIGLLLFLILPLFVFDRNNDRAIYWIYSYYYQLLFMIVAFYANYLFIVPRFFFSKKRIYFFVVIFLFAILLLITSTYLYDLLELDSFRPENIIRRENNPRRNRLGLHPKIVENFILLLVVLGFSSGMAIIQHLRKNETKQKEIEKAHVDSELAFLKNQISPHFFFNALNNIYALIAVDGDEAQKAVEKLSVLMRYLIYDSNTETVELKKEFEFMHNYIDLMQQRLTSKVKIGTDIQPDIPNAEIPPLLFITFVENAFKHGVSYRDGSFIDIALKVEDARLVFSCKNSNHKKSLNSKNKAGGIGISNSKKRLALIYGNQAQLKTDCNEEVFFVELIIPLKLNS